MKISVVRQQLPGTPNYLKVLAPVLALAALFCILVLVSGSTQARTITVDDDGGSDHVNIQPAINEAEDGDTVRVYRGNYAERLTINKSIELVGVSRDYVTVERSYQSGKNLVDIRADNVTLTGFTLKYKGPGIVVKESNNCSISDTSVIINQKYAQGISISKGHNISIDNCRVEGPVKHGIVIGDCVDVLVSDTSVHRTTDLSIGLTNCRNGLVTGTTCSDNDFYQALSLRGTNLSATGNHFVDAAMGLYVDSYGAVITNNSFESNYYGIELESSGNVVTGNRIFNSTNSGIFVDDDNHLIANNLLRGNEKGIFFDTGRGNMVEENVIENNTHGIYLKDSPEISIHNNTITGNSISGINASENGGFVVNATDNWWKTVSGPYHPVNNTEGLGDNVTDFVEFSPWLTVPWKNLRPVAKILGITPNPALDTETISYNGTGSDDGSVEAWSWRVVGGKGVELYKGPTPPATLSAGMYTIHFRV